MSEFYQIQAVTTSQGMVPQLALIQGETQQQAPRLLADLLQWVVKVELDEEKRDIGRITGVEQQEILWKKEWIPQTTKPGMEKGYYVYIEDDDDIYLEPKMSGESVGHGNESATSSWPDNRKRHGQVLCSAWWAGRQGQDQNYQ